MPSTEHTHYLSTEADVVRASILQLLHPVNSIASRLISQGHGELRCLSEHNAHMYCRTDIVWTYQQSPHHSPKYVAVLEFKNCRSLHWEDFENATISHQQDASLKMYQAAGKVNGTCLKRNATIISQQARKYNYYTRCDDVAIFDWNSMFLYDFSTMNEDGPHKTLVSGWFHTQETQGTSFRLLLLGFLTRAMERHGIIPHTVWWRAIKHIFFAQEAPWLKHACDPFLGTEVLECIERLSVLHINIIGEKRGKDWMHGAPLTKHNTPLVQYVQNWRAWLYFLQSLPA